MKNLSSQELAAKIFSALAEDGLRVVHLLGQGRYTIPSDAEIKAAIEIAISEAQS